MPNPPGLQQPGLRAPAKSNATPAESEESRDSNTEVVKPSAGHHREPRTDVKPIGNNPWSPTTVVTASFWSVKTHTSNWGGDRRGALF